MEIKNISKECLHDIIVAKETTVYSTQIAYCLRCDAVFHSIPDSYELRKEYRINFDYYEPIKDRYIRREFPRVFIRR